MTMTGDEPTNILVVDDLPENLLVYRAILDVLGQNLVTAGSGEEALRAVLGHDFAVILLDVNMPGLNGLEAASLIRQRRRSAHTPIIFMTAFADEVRAAEGYAQGAVDYLTTPVVPAVLRAKVRVFTDLYRMTQQVRRQAEERVALAEERTKREAAEEATRRSHFLADVSRALADSLDPDTTARRMARLTVPFLADLASLTLAGEPGRPWRTELAWSAPGEGEPAGRRVTRPDAPDDPLRQAVERALAGGPTEHIEGLDIPYPTALDPAAPPDGRVKSAVVVPLLARGRILGALGLAFGPSGRRHSPADVALAEDLASRAATALDNARLYQEVQQADRQKNDFLSMLAHELRNPLAPIRNANEILRASEADPARVRWAQGIIDRQITHLVRLVDDLLDVSRLTLGKIRLAIETVDLEAVVGQAVEATRPTIDQFRHQLEVNLPARPARFQGDPTRLTQVLANLLNNAAKYTPGGGRIWLSVSVRKGDAARAGESGDAEFAEVRVRDNGVGIAPDLLPRVFDPFTQANRSLDRSQGGLGIGLTLVRCLVEMHRGSVEAHSAGLGQGSEFVVRLPIVPDQSRPREAEPATPAGAPGEPDSFRVVVVDDHRDGAESLVELLTLLGYQVQAAHDGPTGIATVLEFRPDVVLLDIGLPGMNGFEVARRLRANPDVGAVLVAISGYGREEDRLQAREAGFEHHFVKPVELAALRNLLNSIRVRRGGLAAPTFN